MRPSRIGLLLLAATWIALPLSASATTARALSLSDLAASSEVVVRGQVEGTEAEWHGEYIVTRATLRVDECLAGDCGETVEVVQVGGTVGDITMEVAGSHLLDAGDEVVVFLRPNAGVDGLVPVGMAQGVFYAQPGSDVLSRHLEDIVLIAPEGLVQGIGEVPASYDALRGHLVELRTRPALP